MSGQTTSARLTGAALKRGVILGPTVMTDHDGMKVTAIVPTYNRAELISESLAALFAQSRAVDEVIVVDDGSTDATPEVLANQPYPISILRKPNAGKATALNDALAQTTADLVWIVDDDDLVAPDALERLIAPFLNDQLIDLTYGRHDRFRDSGEGERAFLGTGYWTACDPDDFLVETLMDFFVHQPGMLARKTLYDKAGPFDQQLNRSLDYEMLIRLARHGRVQAVEGTVFHQRLHDGERGAAGQRLKASDRDAHWQNTDRQIITAVYNDLPLTCYVSEAGPTLAPVAHRQALIQRAAIVARKELWPLALDDLQAAIDVSEAPLNPAEIALLRRAFSSKYGADYILNRPDIVSDLMAFKARSALARAMIASIGRGLRWRIRHAWRQRRPLVAARYLTVSSRLMFG